MALSKPNCIGKVHENVTKLSIDEAKIKEFCEVTYAVPISIEVIEHILAGTNLDYIPMELENPFQCFDFCRADLLKILKDEKKELLFFEDRNCYSSSVIIAATLQPRTKHKREHVLFYCVARLTVMVEPKVGIARYFKFIGEKIMS